MTASRRSLAALAVAVLALSAGLVQGGAARGSGGGFAVVFVGGLFGDERVFAVDAGGRRRRALREPLGSARRWAFSASGRVAINTGNGLLVGRTREGLASVAASGTMYDVEWSPDGRTLAYADTTGGGIFVVGSSGPRLLVDGLFEGWASSSRVAFVADAGTLYTVNVDGSDRRRIAGNGEKAFARWSPDGRVLAYTMGAGSTNRLCLERVGSSRRCRALTQTWPHSFAWSPTGASLAFITYEGVWTVRRDGSRLRRLYSLTNQFADNVAWSPDGSMLLFELNERKLSLGQTAVWVVRATGVGARRVAVARMEGARASWAPMSQLRSFERVGG